MTSDGPADPSRLDDDTRARIVEPAGPAMMRLASVMARLRGPGGCPWDREQTHSSLAPYLLEETHETLEAIETGDAAALLEELGDVLLQVVFHAQVAAEDGGFTVADVADTLVDKLVRRHPHVFGDLEVSGADEVHKNWERLKRTEKPSSTLGDLPPGLPSLSRAAKLTRRASQSGLDLGSMADRLRSAEEAGTRVAEAAGQDDIKGDGTPSAVEEALGDLLFATASVGPAVGVDPETALLAAAARFRRRFEAAERRAAARGRDLQSLSPTEWQEYWDDAGRESGDDATEQDPDKAES